MNSEVLNFGIYLMDRKVKTLHAKTVSTILKNFTMYCHSKGFNHLYQISFDSPRFLRDLSWVDLAWVSRESGQVMYLRRE